MSNKHLKMMLLTVLLASTSSVWAQQPVHQEIAVADKDSMPGMDHSKMGHGKSDQDAKPAAVEQHAPEHDMSTMKKGETMDSGTASAPSSAPSSAQGGSAPPDARSPDYSDGHGFGDLPRPVFADEHNFASLLVDRLEYVDTDDRNSTTYDLQAWFGRDYDRIVLKAEGDIDSGTLEEASTELLWGHAIATFWDTQLGVRYDSGEEGPDRTWLAFGVQGLAPYWFEVDATAYIGESGRSAFSFEAEYELLLTQKIILQPRFEMDWYGKNDDERGIGSGASTAAFGIRLRYEIRREIAPYIGVEWTQQYGDTKDFTRAAGGDPSETRFVAGLRFWF